MARSATRFFSGLTFADRSGLALLPVGQGVAFTWAHATVRDALQRVVGTAAGRTTWEYGSLADARDIALSNTMALRNLGQRQCGGSILAGGGGGGGGGGVSRTDASRGSRSCTRSQWIQRRRMGSTGTESTGSGGRTGGGLGGWKLRHPSVALVRTAACATCRCRPNPPGARRKSTRSRVSRPCGRRWHSSPTCAGIRR